MRYIETGNSEKDKFNWFEYYPCPLEANAGKFLFASVIVGHQEVKSICPYYLSNQYKQNY